MALTLMSAFTPDFVANSSDISGSKIAGLSVVGALVYIIEEQKFYQVALDLTLTPMVWNVV
jgi:hypothetical protein